MKRFFLIGLILLLVGSYVYGSVPCKINYQGRLIKDNVPVDGTKTMVFSIYDSVVGPTLLWTSGDVSVEVHNGLFRYVIGSDGGNLSSMDWAAGQTLYLEVVIDGETLTPREELSAYPYAINSHLLEGQAKEYFLNTSGDTQTKQGDLNIGGNLSVGGFQFEHKGYDFLLGTDDGREKGNKESQRALVHGNNDRLLINYNTDFEGGVEIQPSVYISTTGNVGIGTAPGSWKLSVAGGDNSFTWAGDHSSSNYIRIGDLQICWGRSFIYGSASGIESIGFPAAFSETPRVIVNRLTQANYSNHPDFNILVRSVDVNLFNLAWYGAPSGWVIDGQNYAHYHDWIAIGRWQ